MLIAIPSASGPKMVRILEHCKDAGLRCKTPPGVGELVRGAGLAVQIRDVAVEDLLSRTPIEIDQTGIRASSPQDCRHHRRGWIHRLGLCRQIARFQPLAIVGFDIAETALFYLEREMRASFPDALLPGNRRAFRTPSGWRRYSSATGLPPSHAAAYKTSP